MYTCDKKACHTKVLIIVLQMINLMTFQCFFYDQMAAVFSIIFRLSMNCGYRKDIVLGHHINNWYILLHTWIHRANCEVVF